MCEYVYRINSARQMRLSRAEDEAGERERTHKLYSRVEQPDRKEKEEQGRKKPESGRQGCVAARAML